MGFVFKCMQWRGGGYALIKFGDVSAAQKLFSCFVTFPFFYRGSAQQVEMEGTTVTPISPAPSTQRTSAASLMTVETSSSGCTCGSTSCCDGRGKVLGQKDKTRSDYGRRKRNPWTCVSELFCRSMRALVTQQGPKHTLIVNTPWTQKFPWCKLSTWCRIFDGWVWGAYT